MCLPSNFLIPWDETPVPMLDANPQNLSVWDGEVMQEGIPAVGSFALWVNAVGASEWTDGAVTT